LNGQNETIGSFSNSGGTFTTGAGTLIGTAASFTWSGGTNTVSTGGAIQDGHVAITGGTNTVQSGGTLEILSGGSGLEFGGTASPTLTLTANATSPGK